MRQHHVMIQMFTLNRKENVVIIIVDYITHNVLYSFTHYFFNATFIRSIRCLSVLMCGLNAQKLGLNMKTQKLNRFEEVHKSKFIYLNRAQNDCWNLGFCRLSSASPINVQLNYDVETVSNLKLIRKKENEWMMNWSSRCICFIFDAQNNDN